MELWPVLQEQIDQDLEGFTADDFKRAVQRFKKDILHNPKVSLENHYSLVVNLTPQRISFLHARKHDARVKICVAMLQSWFHWMVAQKIPIPTCQWVWFVNDTYYYHDQSLPLGLFSKPANKRGFLLPDNTLFAQPEGGNRDLPSRNHDQYVEWFLEQCPQPWTERIPHVYFKGANTGAKKWDLRDQLRKAVQDSEQITIELSGKYRPQTHFCDYQVLLNLPGQQPWSYRFRELFLTGSLVVHLAFYVTYDQGKTWNQPWIHFWSGAFQPDQHYLELEYYWWEGSTPEIQQKNEQSLTKLVGQIEELYRDIQAHPDKYQPIVDRGRKQMQELTMEQVYLYFTRLSHEIATRSS